MTEVVYKYLTEWNPKKGDVFAWEDFEYEDNVTVRITSDTHFRADYWPEDYEDEPFDFWDDCTRVRLVSRATPEEPPVGKWVGHNGGECPVHPKTIVETVYLKKVIGNDAYYTEIGKTLASETLWDCVVTYRVLKEYKEPKKYWVYENGHGDLCVSATWRLDAIHVKEVIYD